MKKRIFPRLLVALFVSLTAFVLLSAMQFSQNGTLSRQMGDMLVTWRNFNGEGAATGTWVNIGGAATVVFGGLEFRLADAAGANEGLTIVDSGNARHQALPDRGFISNKYGLATAAFPLSHDVELSFVLRDYDGVSPELWITATLPEGIHSIDVPFRPRRSSVTWDNSRGILGVTYGGDSRMFSRQSRGLVDGRLVLTAGAPTVLFQTMPDVIANDLADFVTPGMESAAAFSAALAAWTDRSFDLWGADSSADGDRAVALGAEALRRGAFGSTATATPAAFGQARHVWEPAVFQFDRSAGAWERGVREIIAAEERKIALVGDLLSRGDYGNLFEENRLIEFLAARGHNALVNDVVAAAHGIDPSIVTLRASAGILENHVDLANWRPAADNPFGQLAARARQLVADGLRQDGERVLVFSADGRACMELNLRLGKALRAWGERAGDGDWAALGRSLTLSVLAQEDANGAVPATLTSAASGHLTASAERIGSASLFRMLDESEFLPRAVATGVDGVWAWTAARSINLVQTANFMDIVVDFPAGQTHYVMLRGVRPFALLQMHGQNTGRNPSFEESNVSGWDYFADEQTLVIKLHHRANVERVRVLFTVPAVVASPPPAAVVRPAPVAPAPAAAPAPAPAPPPALPSPPLRRPWSPAQPSEG